MARVETTQVLVVGAGPVGLFAALNLVEHGLDVRIIDQQWDTAGHSYALGLHGQTLELLDELGLSGELSLRGWPVHRIAFHAPDRALGEVDLDRAVASGHPSLLVLPQSELENVLAERLRQRGIAVRWNHRLAQVDPGPELVAVQVQRLGDAPMGYAVAVTEKVVEKTLAMQAELVLGADGVLSTVRRQADISFEEYRPARVFAVFEVDVADWTSHEAAVVLDRGSLAAMWPLAPGRCRWSFEIDPASLPAGRDKSPMGQVGGRLYPNLDAAALHRFLAQRAPWFKARITSVTWSLAVRFEQRLAASMGHERLWLMGDAAHVAMPTGLLSMNVGLAEARDLAARISDARHHGQGVAVLADYDRHWRCLWRGLLGVEQALAPGPAAPLWVREHAADVLASLPAWGEARTALAGQLGFVRAS